VSISFYAFYSAPTTATTGALCVSVLDPAVFAPTRVLCVGCAADAKCRDEHGSNDQSLYHW
jgi:hypothetical protein